MNFVTHACAQQKNTTSPAHLKWKDGQVVIAGQHDCDESLRSLSTQDEPLKMILSQETATYIAVASPPGLQVGVNRAFGKTVEWDRWTGAIRNPMWERSTAVARPRRNVSESVRQYANARRHSQLTLASSLAALADRDPACVIYARQVQKLGFESAEILRQHYSAFGRVDDVLLSNAHEKTPGASFRVRVRPSGIALIVMQSKHEVASILALGEEQVVYGVSIRVRQFQERCQDEGKDFEIAALSQKATTEGEEDSASNRSTSFGDSIDCHSEASSVEA